MKWIRILKRAARLWWQRRIHGWDESDLWNLDHSLAKLILPRLKAFAKNTHGYPGSSSEEQWAEDLRTMIAAFEVLASDRCWDIRSEREEAEIQRGLDLFGTYFRALWI